MKRKILIKVVGVVFICAFIYGGFSTPATAVEKKIFKAAHMNAGPAGSQWGKAVLRGQKASKVNLKREFPNIDVQWFNSWNLKPADVKSIVESYIADGFQFIISTDFTQPQFKKIIEAHPEVYFAEPSFTLAKTPNVGTFTWDVHIGLFLTGIVAGGVTKTNKIGFITAFESPYDAWTFHSATQGALRVNPDAKLFYTFTGDYHDISLGYKAASALIAVGCDFILAAGNGMTSGAIKAAADAGIYSAGVYSDQYDLAPKSVVTSNIWDFGVALTDALRDVLKGTFKNPRYEYRLKDKTTSLAPFRQHKAIVPDIVREELAKVFELSEAGKLYLYPVKKFPPEQAIR